ncbi:MAG: hypothetical protein OXU23_25785 [Candidatus Poribacteria bacterium]|nr:hypothetical protein [Candidatus Poribacteria bacterium]MDE0468629.1 hypothetical protein [Candidatus Poribacteria bacterium]
MKISSTFYALVLLTMLLTFSMPFVTLAQQNLLAEAVADAERDARKYADSGRWFGIGCLFSPSLPYCGPYFLPILRTMVDESISLPPTRLLGKSPEYIRLYTAAYSKKIKEIRTDSATAGCCLPYVLLAGCLIAMGLSSE